MCRVAETATAQVRSLDFIEAARATGAGTFTIVRYHVLGNVLGPVFIYASSLVSVSILLASGLSFLGLGVKPPTPDWGLMLSTLRQSIYVAPLSCALPGAAIFVTSTFTESVAFAAAVSAIHIGVARLTRMGLEPPKKPL